MSFKTLKFTIARVKITCIVHGTLFRMMLKEKYIKIKEHFKKSSEGGGDD